MSVQIKKKPYPSSISEKKKSRKSVEKKSKVDETKKKHLLGRI